MLFTLVQIFFQPCLMPQVNETAGGVVKNVECKVDVPSAKGSEHGDTGDSHKMVVFAAKMMSFCSINFWGFQWPIFDTCSVGRCLPQFQQFQSQDIDKVNVSQWGHTAMIGNTVCALEALDPLEAGCWSIVELRFYPSLEHGFASNL